MIMTLETPATINVPEVSAQEVTAAVDEMNTKGYACLLNYVQPDDLDRMQSFVSSAIRDAGNEYVHFNGPDAVTGSGLEELSRSARFKKLIYDVHLQGTGRRMASDECYQVLRCLTGNSGQKHAFMFHYDSYIVTALVPIQIPAQGQAGDLLMYPNTRNIRSKYLFNAMDKVLLDNPITQKVLRSFVNGKSFAPERVALVPGNLYLFWGYRTIHTNEPCDPDKVRATALFHYSNPHKHAPVQMS